ncbi:MAG: PEP-CTERM sorting domain-containing protein [Candidatus Nealsonbacteria bacterium]|nr:PEP-CTERM sorting domain-containing protein [Candidatus Nealsonbacteria bacterium]
MKHAAMICLAVVAVLAMTTTGAMAQNSDNFDSYTAGLVIPPGNGWVGWGGPSANCIVTAGPANSSPNSLAAVGGAGTDQVFEFGYGPKTGLWDFSTMTYVPSDGQAGETYFNLMNKFDDAGGVYEWSVVGVHWMMDATNERFGKVYNDNTPAGEGLDIIYDAWVEVGADIDLDNNLCEIFYGGASLGAPVPWSGAAVLGIEVMDIYPISGDASVIYYDNVSLTQVPEPSSLLMLLGVGFGAVVVYRRRRR